MPLLPCRNSLSTEAGGRTDPLHVIPNGGATLATESSVAGDGSPPRFLLDLVSGTETDAHSLRRLTEIAAATMSARTVATVDCAATLIHGQRSPVTAANNPRATTFERLELEYGGGSLTEAIRGARPIILGDVTTDSRWPKYRQRLRTESNGGVIAIPLRLKVGSLGASPAGVIMAQNRCSYAEAFSILATATTHRNVKVRTVAEGILRDLPGGPPGTRFQPKMRLR